MTEKRWLQVGAAGGILFVGLLFGSSLIGAAGEPAFDAPANQWLAYVRNSHDALQTRGYAAEPALTCFLLFVGCLYRRLRRANRASIPALTMVLSAGVMITLLLAAGGAGGAALIRVGKDLDASAASILFALANEFFVASWFAIGGMLFASGLGALSSRALPAWLGWSGLVIGLGMVIAVPLQLTPLWLIPYWLYLVWVVSVSVVFFRDAGRT